MNSIGPDDLTAAIRAAVIAIGDREPADVSTLGDTLWLAASIAARAGPEAEKPGDLLPAGPAAVPGRAGKPMPGVGDEPGTQAADGPPESRQRPERELFDPGGTGTGGAVGGAAARSVDLSGPAGLRERLELARALRPFRRTMPSRHRQVLDVEATVRGSAAARRTLPILRPAAERRFSADLVFDASPSMEVWDDAFGQLAEVFRHAGAFSEVRKWSLHTDDERDEVWLIDRNGYRSPPAALRSADGRRVILMMTDGVGDRWYSPGVWACLADWGSRGPTGLMDPLPVKLWSLSGIGPSRVRVRASSSGAPNIDLQYKQLRVLSREDRPASVVMPVPITEFSPATLLAWSATVADAHPDGCVAVLARHEFLRTATAPWPGDADAEGSLTNFIHTASPAALRLAVLASVSEAMDLAVLRAIQDEMLPSSSTSDLAEVLVSGIFWREPDLGRPGDQASLRIRMDPACRTRLRERASVQDWWDVYRAVSSAFTRIRPAAAARFRAAVLHPSGDVRIPADQRAFAEVAQAALADAQNGSRPVLLPATAPPIRVFLSYAQEDGDIARDVAEALSNLGLNLAWRQDPQRRGDLSIMEIEEEISRADAFVALVSPSYLGSAWCSRERELALLREVSAGEATSGFVHALLIRDIPPGAGDFLQSYDWADLTAEWDRAQLLGELAGRLAARRTSGDQALERRAAQVFRNRREELDKVVNGLTEPAGPHFWLVVAPPQLGKTRFLGQLLHELRAKGAATASNAGWDQRTVDLRLHPDARSDAGVLLAKMFDLSEAVPADPAALRGLARQIRRTNVSLLCMLDSAELLEAQAAEQFRWCMSKLYDLIPAGRACDSAWWSRAEAWMRGAGARPPRASPICR